MSQITIDTGYFEECLILAKQTERERVIKLLDELHESKNQSHHITNRSGVCVTCRAIALIKAGE